MKQKTCAIVKWTGRILALCILLFALPFYFGYGNPLPFVDPNYSIWENMALTAMPLVFIGLILGWKYPKAGGFLVVIPIVVGFLVGVLTSARVSVNLLFPLLPGILYLVTGYQCPGKRSNR